MILIRMALIVGLLMPVVGTRAPDLSKNTRDPEAGGLNEIHRSVCLHARPCGLQ